MSLKYANGRFMIKNSKNLLDQYFTKEEVAKKLIKKTEEIIKKYENINSFTWIDPSSGGGSFYSNIKHKNKIGVDIDPKIKGQIKSDYLKFELPKGKKIIIGNPPFGHRGVLALEFINHSKDADFVCMILPMYFDSKGKGSLKYRIKNLNLIYSEVLPENAFYSGLDNKDVKIKCVFQIWSKNYKSKEKNDFSWYSLKNYNPFKKYLDLFTVSLANNRECGKRWIFDEKADYYLSTTFYKNNKTATSFDKVKYKSGIAIVINAKNTNTKNKLKKIIEEANWNKYSSLATNSCKHIGKSHIYELLYDNGFKPEMKNE